MSLSKTGILKTCALTTSAVLFSLTACADDDASDLNVLPRPDPEFHGVIGKTAADSTPDFPEPFKAPEGSPNVLLIMTDDVGFSATSSFGGPIELSTFDSLAMEGLRYNSFHTTAMSSPTRASLLTGHNHHVASTGAIMEMATGYPGYNSLMSKSCGSIGEILKQNGYSTSWFGKNHNVPDWHTSTSGPFDLWPTGLGFEYFYGFLGGETSQWNPLFYEGTKPMEKQPGEEDLHFDQMMADKAIHWLKSAHAIDPDKPFFMYYTPGTAHSPHHAPREYIEMMKGQFDQGWDKLREETYQRQLAEGIIPPGTQMTPKPDAIPDWDSLSDKEKELYSRMMEVYAAALRHCDDQLGRVVQTIEDLGRLDNTIIIYVMGDNGPSGEGGMQGKVSDFADEDEPFEFVYSMIDELGGPNVSNHYPTGWAHALTTPMQWTKQIASHFGGTRNGLVISWPEGIKAKNEIRTQFHHVIDIVPTILDMLGIEAPDMINGVEQRPMDGISMRYTFEDPSVPSMRTTQYFELVANRAIYHEGWMASTTPVRMPWSNYSDGTNNPDDFEWELYHIAEDFSQANNLVDVYPDKLKELQDVFDAEAKKNQVYPLDMTFFERGDVSLRPSLTEGRTSFEYFQGMDRLPEGAAPDTKARSFEVFAEIEVPAGLEGETASSETVGKPGDGMIATMGGRGAGWALYILDGYPTFAYSNSYQIGDNHQFRIAGDKQIPPGKHTLLFKFDCDEPGTLGSGGTGTLFLNDEQVAQGYISKTVTMRYSIYDSFDVGLDRGSPTVDDYLDLMPFKYPGIIDKVTITLGEK